MWPTAVQIYTHQTLQQQGRTGEDGHSPVTPVQSLRQQGRTVDHGQVQLYTKLLRQQGGTVEDGHSPVTPQTLQQQGGTVEDGYIHLSRRLDRGGDREEDQPTNQQTRSKPRRLQPQTTEAYSHTDTATMAHSQHRFPEPSSKLCHNWTYWPRLRTSLSGTFL